MYTIDVTDKMVLLTDGLILLILLIFVWIIISPTIETLLDCFINLHNKFKLLRKLMKKNIFLLKDKNMYISLKICQGYCVCKEDYLDSI